MRGGGKDAVRQSREHGLTMIELMISMALGLMITAIGMVLLLSSRAAYGAHDENIEMQQSASFALELMARSLNQAGYQAWGEENSPIVFTPHSTPDIAGLDAHSLKATSPNLEVPLKSSVNGSDVLAIRFFGAEDGMVLNCAGFSIDSSESGNSEEARGWSIFYVAADSGGEPELRCKYKGKSSWRSDAIARGIESFQVLYGMDTDADGLANRFLTATEIDAMDDGLPLTAPNAAARALERNAKSLWKKVVSVKVALLVRGSQSTRADALDKKYALFGAEYCDKNSRDDPGGCLDDAAFPVKVRSRARKIFVMTIPLRNRLIGVGA
jgi:type IV pilus assembly protein PilW